MPNFQLLSTDSASAARTGLLHTAHGDVQTPAFMPVGTAAAVKGITPRQLTETGAEMILANTYHLLLRPGVEAVETIGGLHKLMSWNRPILTDSGGYQIFSLSSLAKVSKKGVEFASHVDGKKIFLSPKTATRIQNHLGADVIMCLDQCTPFPCPQPELKDAVERSLDWAKQCREAHANNQQLLFGIVQGGIDLSLREHCADKLVELDFDGYAIGGLSVGEGHENMLKTVTHTAKLLPIDKPRYLMGVGTPADIIAAVKAGVDMFDCVLPTRNGRNACAFTSAGTIRLRNSVYIRSTEPVDPACDCYCCENFTRAALRHFFNVSEMLGPILVSIHNLHFYQKLMATIRQKINENNFTQWTDEQLIV